MKSRMQARLRQMDALNSSRRASAAVAEQIAAADADIFELAARVALGAWDARKATDTSDAFAVGYRTAAAELALVLRAMRRQVPPEQVELAAIEKGIRAEYEPDDSANSDN